MNCCQTTGTNRFFSKHARRYAKRFRRKGLDGAQKLLEHGLVQAGIRSKTILEIGCGIGAMHLTLLQQGASGATGIDMAEGMLKEARRLSGELGFAERTTYLAGDFVKLNGGLQDADIVIADKVVCCYENATGLIRKSTAASKSLYAISYPRQMWIARWFFEASAWIGEMLRWSFHPYYHEPEYIENLIQQEGFEEVHAGNTMIWQVRVYRRKSVVGTMERPSGRAT